MALNMKPLTVAKKWHDHFEDGHSVVYLFQDPHAREEFFAIVYSVTGPCDVYTGNREYMSQVQAEELTITGDPGWDDSLDINLSAGATAEQYDVDDISDDTERWDHPVTGQEWLRVEPRDYVIMVGTDGNDKGVMQVEPKS